VVARIQNNCRFDWLRLRSRLAAVESKLPRIEAQH